MTQGVETEEYDVLVVGAGAGGLAAAAVLAHAGRRVLLVEREDRVGGRASTIEIDGFRVSTGAVALEVGGPMERLFRDVGAPYEVREPTVPGTVVQFRGRTFDTTSRVARMLVDGGLRCGGALVTRRWSREEARGGPTLEEWLSRWTANRTLHRLLRNVAAGVFSVNANEVPARAMLTYLTQKGAFRTYGYPPEGTVGPMRRLAEVVERRGGAVWLSAEVEQLEVEDGRVTAATVLRGGRQLRVVCDAIVCNAGPTATVALVGEEALPEAYVTLVHEQVHPAPMFAVTFASQRPLTAPAGIVFFADTERVAALAHLTSTVHEVAPPGWHLYVAYAVPTPAMSPFDEDAERAHVMAELACEVEGFDDARILAAPLLRGDWPAQRVVSGSEIDSATPIANLWNVGDATRAYGDGGVQGCMTNGRQVAHCVLAAVRPRAAVPAQA